MTCANCIALREELRRAQRELGVRRRDGAIGAIMHRIKLPPVQAMLALDMYEAAGRCVGRDILVQNAKIVSEQSLRAHICQMRQVLGAAAISTFEGVGYALAAPGLSQVLAALEPLELQDVRLTEAAP